MIAVKPYSKKPPQFSNQDVVNLIEDYKQWLLSADKNITFSSFCCQYGIKNPQHLKDYLLRKFTGINGKVDFAYLWQEAEHMREDKLIELGIFNKHINANFLLSVMNHCFLWHSNTMVVGLSADDIMRAKKQGDELVSAKAPTMV